MAIKKISISALPLPPTSHILTHNLTPDTQTPSTRSLREVLTDKPSVQRRSRLVDPSAHFSHVTPFPWQFPYRISPPEDVEDKSEYVEQWLSEREALDEVPPAGTDPSEPGGLKKYTSTKRDLEADLIALSDTGLRDCLPNLDVGDTFVHIGDPSLSLANEDQPHRKVSGSNTASRQELVDVLSGKFVLMAIGDEAKTPYAPWSLRYSGHQFGSWAGQLGDGRAISILETPHPSDPDLTYELQLKGAGRTPFSRSADGLAVLRSSIREYLCAEAMNALHIPTTRSLSLIHLPTLEVYRETIESACVLTRMAPSFIRIGSFEALNTPQKNMYYFGGGQQGADFDALRILGEWVVRRVLKLPLTETNGKPEKWGKRLVIDVARRNAKMVAGWQAYGFMHGVINTDNVSILGLTIDYGPYAFMDIYEPLHICNHTDETGRYAYKSQPPMIVYALRALLRSLTPLIGCEEESGHAISAGWAKEASQETIDSWTEKGMEIEQEMVDEFEKVHGDEYWRLMRRRLGLLTEEPSDADQIISSLLGLLQTHRLDYPTVLRRIASFKPSIHLPPTSTENSLDYPDLNNFASFVLKDATFDADIPAATTDLSNWLLTFGSRLQREKDAWVAKCSEKLNGGSSSETNGTQVDWESERTRVTRLANPRFVLRQWLLEEIIHRMNLDPLTGKRALAKVHEMAVKPYNLWGAEDADSDAVFDDETKEERRYCGLGTRKFIGFQCSCSS